MRREYGFVVAVAFIWNLSLIAQDLDQGHFGLQFGIPAAPAPDILKPVNRGRSVASKSTKRPVADPPPGIASRDFAEILVIYEPGGSEGARAAIEAAGYKIKETYGTGHFHIVETPDLKTFRDFLTLRRRIITGDDLRSVQDVVPNLTLSISRGLAK